MPIYRLAPRPSPFAEGTLCNLVSAVVGYSPFRGSHDEIPAGAQVKIKWSIDLHGFYVEYWPEGDYFPRTYADVSDDLMVPQIPGVASPAPGRGGGEAVLAPLPSCAPSSPIRMPTASDVVVANPAETPEAGRSEGSIDLIARDRV